MRSKILRPSWGCLAFALFAIISEASPISLVSQKQGLSIVLRAPMGWNGPAFTQWPSYETWSFSKGKDSLASYIEIRIDPAREPGLDRNTATKEQIKKTFDDFSNPVVEKVGDIAIENISVVVWAVHNVDGELMIATLRRKGFDFTFSLRSNSRAELRLYQKTFLDTIRSVKFR